MEDTSVQVCWDHAPPGAVVVSAGDRQVVAEGTGGPGGVVVEGLPPATCVDVEVRCNGLRPVRAGRVSTLTPPPGRRLSRFAAINDLHIGARCFGLLRPYWDDDRADPAPVRCARAAIAEARAWGADALVVKGDVTQAGRHHEWETAAGLLASAGMPVLIIEGNHDTKYPAVDARAILAAHGLAMAPTRPSCLDLPGARIVGVPTPCWHSHSARVDRSVAAETAALLAAAPGPSVVAMHHYPQRFRYPTFYPAGIPGPLAREVIDSWAAANPSLLVLAGHSHRHRRHDRHGIVLAESGSTKDFPGTWSGYTVHEGGIVQTTRRVTDPSAMAWTERGRRALGGAWGLWAPGLRSHRCFSYVWPPRRAPRSGA